MPTGIFLLSIKPPTSKRRPFSSMEWWIGRRVKSVIMFIFSWILSLLSSYLDFKLSHVNISPVRHFHDSEFNNDYCCRDNSLCSSFDLACPFFFLLLLSNHINLNSESNEWENAAVYSLISSEISLLKYATNFLDNLFRESENYCGIKLAVQNEQGM